MSRLREIKRTARRDLHREAAVPALYIAAPSATPVPCTVRTWLKTDNIFNGNLKDLKAAEVTESEERLRFDLSEIAHLRRNAIVSVEAGEAYRIDFTYPEDIGYQTVRVLRLTAAEAAGLPLPSAAQFPASHIIPPVSVQGGFGTIDYSDQDAGTAIALPANTWVRVNRALIPSPANFNLPGGPWYNFPFYADGKLRARALGDVYLYKLSYRVVSSVRATTFRFALRPGGNPAFDFGPSALTLDGDAGDMITNSTTFSQQARSRFVNEGAEIYAMMSADGQLLEFSPEITPLSHSA